MKTIMVVDDENSVQQKIKDFLNKDDYKIISVKDSRQAFKMLDENKDNDYNLFLIDSPLPGFKDKYGLVSMKPDEKISNHKSHEDDFLKKPFTKQQLLDFIREKM